MDEVDLTAERDEREAPMRILASRRPNGPVPTGRCAWCEELVHDMAIFCDSGCRVDFERSAAAQFRNGRTE